ncbi:class I SAM-dependent methyltransferase [Amycolatopsis sp. NPDC051903]|uniref:class I SAM-dependent methyltransferase n=1 Tax=Amycolatopsis sp. NPDC051903 TaxID=3363936 RepID=UPI00378C3890
MGTTAFTAVENSLYLTLDGRVLDSRAPRPVLGDPTAAGVAEALGHDSTTAPLVKSQVFDIAVRSRILDDVVRSFVARHPDAVVLELGAGLDGRIERVRPPSTVDWYDLDLPAVVAARERLLPAHPNVHPIAADLTEPGWLDRLPEGRPAVAVADGLVAFLPQDAFVALLSGLAHRFPEGEIAFNSYTRFHVWAIKHYRGTGSIAGVVANPGFDDPRDPQRWVPELALVEELFATRAPEVALQPLALRWFTRLAARSATLSRRGTCVLRYRF